MKKLSNRAGKVIELNNNSTVDLKALFSNTHNYQLANINIDQIQCNQQYFDIKNDEKGPAVKLSEQTLGQSIRLYGMVEPILIGRTINQDGTNQFMLIDGYKRFKVLKTDHIKQAKAIILDIPANIINSIIRFLSNQRVKLSIPEYLTAAKNITDKTDSIKNNFIEPALGLQMNDLIILNKARQSNDIQVKRTYQRFIEETTDINSVKRMLKRSEKGETKPVIYQRHDQKNNENDVEPNKAEPNSNINDSTVITSNKNNDLNTIESPINKTNPYAKSLPTSSNHNNIENNSISQIADNPINNNSLTSVSTQVQPSQNVTTNNVNHQKVGQREILSRELRLKVISRDNNRCQVCGIGGKKAPSLTSTFEIHHIIDVQYGGGDKVDNLLTLCPLCHRLITTYGAQKKYILHGLKSYNPTDQELDHNPLFWTIPVLGVIEKTAYRTALHQLKVDKYNLYQRVNRKHTLTIGQALAKYQGTIKFNFSPYKILQFGKLRLTQTKGKLGFQLLNQNLIDEYESFGDSIIDDNQDELHRTIDNLVGFKK